MQTDEPMLLLLQYFDLAYAPLLKLSLTELGFAKKLLPFLQEVRND